MSSDARQALERELGGRVPDGLDTLEEGELTDFADRLREAKQRQSQALERGIDEALEIRSTAPASSASRTRSRRWSGIRSATAGHMVMLERPERFNADLRAFVEEPAVMLDPWPLRET